jgi:hypothetical protein
MLRRSGFEPTRIWTKVSSVDPILEYLGYEQPYSDSDLSADTVLARLRNELEPLVEELNLGYKLHCVARKV